MLWLLLLLSLWPKSNAGNGNTKHSPYKCRTVGNKFSQTLKHTYIYIYVHMPTLIHTQRTHIATENTYGCMYVCVCTLLDILLIKFEPRRVCDSRLSVDCKFPLNTMVAPQLKCVCMCVCVRLSCTSVWQSKPIAYWPFSASISARCQQNFDNLCQLRRMSEFIT